MKRSVKVALASSALAVAGGLFLVGSSYAERGFGGPGMHMASMGGRMGGMMGGHMMGGHMMGGMGRDMLKNIDTDDDGAISQDEIDAAINARFEEFDADANGSLSLEEFQALWGEITKPISVRAFQFLDPDGDAAVSRSELDDRFGDAVSRFDRNDDGKLSPDDHMRSREGRFGPGRGWGRRWSQDDDGQNDDGQNDE
jgi:hypothetical protein